MTEPRVLYDRLHTAEYEGKRLRCRWSELNGRWYFSITDILGIISGSGNPRNYWKAVKNTLRQGGQWKPEYCTLAGLRAGDGKIYLTDCADLQQLQRIIRRAHLKKNAAFMEYLAAFSQTEPEDGMEKIAVRICRDPLFDPAKPSSAGTSWVLKLGVDIPK